MNFEDKIQDPFMYYSIFAPDGTVLRQTVQNAVVESLVAHVQGGGADDGHRPSAVIVQRRTSVATESDGFTRLRQAFRNNDNNANAQNNGEDAEDEKETDESEGESEDEADDGEGKTEDLDK
jgi:adenosine deaminase